MTEPKANGSTVKRILFTYPPPPTTKKKKKKVIGRFI